MDSNTTAPTSTTITTTSKPWYTSKTLWFNVGSGLVTFLAAPELRDILGPDALKYIATVVAGINIALRFATSRPLAGN